jgi:hypothetical protein
MFESQLAAPELVELLAPDDVSSLIGDTHRELARLEHRAAQARATADQLEHRAKLEGADERASTWAIVRMQRFVDGLREEAERDSETLVDAARRRAGSTIDPFLDHPVTLGEAGVRASVAPQPDVAPRHDVALAPVPPPMPAAEAPVAPPAAPVAPVPVVQAAPVVDAPAPATSLQWSPVDDVSAESNGAAHAPVAPTGVAAPVVEPPGPAVEVAPVVPIAPAPVPPSSDAPKRRGLLRGFPLSAVLEVLAVLLVLLFILLRLS